MRYRQALLNFGISKLVGILMSFFTIHSAIAILSICAKLLKDFFNDLHNNLYLVSGTLQ